MSTTIAPAPTQGTHQRLTFPLSPKYYKGWTAERAIAEVVSNARDEDPDFTFGWQDGQLIIEDGSCGIGNHGLLLGFSHKTDQQIGQFGEGLNAACLVLSRDPKVGRMHVETVGYSFIPQIIRHQLVAVTDNQELPELLALDIEPNDRAHGTRITIPCSRRLAEKVRARFLCLTDSAYEPPPDNGRVLDRPGGCLYIGGVYVNANSKLLFSYDFSLAQAKSAQNRDRTVLDSRLQEQLIGQALRGLTNELLLERWVKAALDGSLIQAEQAFPANPSPTQKRALTAVRKRLYGEQKLCYAAARTDAESVLYCRDRGYTVLDNALGSYGWAIQNLMRAMGIPSSASLYRKPKPQRTKWCKPAELTETEQANLTLAVRIIRAAYGHNAIGRCDAYHQTGLESADAMLEWGGFFDPSDKQRIGVHRRNLQDLRATVRVLGHEAAHRLRYRAAFHDYGDYSRGFEHQLDTMLANALMLLYKRGGLDELETHAERSRAAQCATGAEHERTHQADLARTLIAERMSALDIGSARMLADAAGVSIYCAQQVIRGARRNGHRGCPAPAIEHTEAICDVLGLNAAVVQLALLCEAGIVGKPHRTPYGNTYNTSFTRRRRKTDDSSSGTGRIVGKRGDEIEECLCRLREQGANSSDVDAIDAQLQAAFNSNDSSWAKPYRNLLAAERARFTAS